MADIRVLLELDADEGLASHADGLALQLGAEGTVFVPRPGIDPRARSAVTMPAGIIVRLESSAGESVIANWLTTTAGQLGSGSISARIEGRRQDFQAADPNARAILRSLIEGP